MFTEAEVLSDFKIKKKYTEEKSGEEDSFAKGNAGVKKEKERENSMQFEVGDIVKLKKKHPCGSFEWEILRVGADFRLKCTGCGHQIMIARRQVEKNVKEIRKSLDS